MIMLWELSTHFNMFDLIEIYSNPVYESLSIDCLSVGVVWGALNVRCPSIHGVISSLPSVAQLHLSQI